MAQSKSSSPPKDYRAADYKQLRQGFQHLRDYGNANGVAKETPTRALPDRRDRIERRGLRVEGHTDTVPIATPLYPSNWELSTARAIGIDV